MTTMPLHPRIVEVIDALTDAQRLMQETLDHIPAAQREAPALPDTWSIAQIVEHLLMVEDGSGRLISKLLAQTADTIESDDSTLAHSLDRFQVSNPVRRIVAPPMVTPAAQLSLEQARTGQAVARERVMAAYRQASGRALATVEAPHPVLGPLNGYQWGWFLAQHQRRHVVQMHAVLAALTTA